MECPQELQELLRTLYSFSSGASETLMALCEQDRRISELAEERGKDRSTVQRYVSSLRAAGLVTRRSVTTDEGKGRFFVYSVDQELLKRKVRERLEEWEEEKLATLQEI